jgi:hypothetical protein
MVLAYPMGMHMNSTTSQWLHCTCRRGPTFGSFVAVRSQISYVTEINTSRFLHPWNEIIHDGPWPLHTNIHFSKIHGAFKQKKDSVTGCYFSRINCCKARLCLRLPYYACGTYPFCISLAYHVIVAFGFLELSLIVFYSIAPAIVWRTVTYIRISLDRICYYRLLLGTLGMILKGMLPQLYTIRQCEFTSHRVENSDIEGNLWLVSLFMRCGFI